MKRGAGGREGGSRREGAQVFLMPLAYQISPARPSVVCLPPPQPSPFGRQPLSREECWGGGGERRGPL